MTTKPLSSPARDLLPEMPPHVASEFLLWLCWREAAGTNTVRVGDADVTIEVCENIELKRPAEDKPSVILRGVGLDDKDANEHPELLASLRAGRVIHRVRLRVRSDDREYTVILSGPTLSWSGIKLPKLLQAKSDVQEALHEEVFLYEDLHAAVRGVFAEYAHGRVDAARWKDDGEAIRRWLGETFDRVFDVVEADAVEAD